ncbi:MAG: DUF4173 domain-containing protein [Pseudomonadales bacterium]|nr:DUF4173 domain-containing protein [Pseudomonadales bacterium]
MSTTTAMTNPGHDRVATHTLLAALVLGVAGDILFRDVGPFGVGLSIWVGLLGLSAVALNRHARPKWRRTLIVWSCVAFTATLNPVLRATEELIPLTLLVLLLCAASLLMQARGVRLLAATITDHLRCVLRVPVEVVLGILPILGKVSLFGAGMSLRVRGILRGLMLVTPLMLIFIALFSAADAVFERYVSRLGDVFLFDTPRHILMVLMIGWVAAGLLACTFQRDSNEAMSARSFPAGNTPRLPRKVGDEETAVIMGSLVALFVVFVVLQASYLFGGRELIEQTSGLSLAAYARRGFFELLAVSALTLAVLLSMSILQCNQRLFRPLAGVLVACVLLILISAVQRLGLYIDAFGLTFSRVFALAFILWLACNLLSFALTILRGHSDGFASGLVLSGIAIIMLLGAANPAAVVAQVNLERTIAAGQRLDTHYLISLGADVVPQLMKRFDALPEAEQCQIAIALYHRWHPEKNEDAKQAMQDWRGWNASRSRARRLVMAREDQFQQIITEQRARAGGVSVPRKEGPKF